MDQGKNGTSGKKIHECQYPVHVCTLRRFEKDQNGLHKERVTNDGGKSKLPISMKVFYSLNIEKCTRYNEDRNNTEEWKTERVGGQVILDCIKVKNE